MAVPPTQPFTPSAPLPPAPSPSPSPSPSPVTLMRDDMQSILVYIQGARIVSMAREMEISRFQGWLVDRFIIGAFLTVLALLLVNLWSRLGGWGAGHAAFLSGIVLLAFASRSGAIVSIGRRMRADNLGVGVGGDSIYTLAALGSGENGLALALLSSNTFGLVMFAALASGLPGILGITGGIVPVFAAVEDSRLRDAAGADAMTAAGLKIDAAKCAATASVPAAAADNATAVDEGNMAADADDAGLPPDNAVLANDSAGPVSSGPGNTMDTARAAPPSSCTDLAQKAAAAERAAETSARAAARAEAARVSISPVGDHWIDNLRVALGLSSVPDLFKLLLWAFIAGFFEKFVPDMLDRIAARGRETAQGEKG